MGEGESGDETGILLAQIARLFETIDSLLSIKFSVDIVAKGLLAETSTLKSVNAD